LRAVAVCGLTSTPAQRRELPAGPYRREPFAPWSGRLQLPRRQLIGFAQFIADDVERGSHRGCSFINTIAELPDDAHAARGLIEEHKARQLTRLSALCLACGLNRPDWTAIHLTLILEGAQAVAQNRSVPHLRQHVMQLTEEILTTR
jgi:hypothetical protein